MTNCPNCGAPITSSKCEYCGTVFRDQRIDFLIDENERLKQVSNIERLYNDAIFAIRAYSSGVLTVNEARKCVGLPRIGKEKL